MDTDGTNVVALVGLSNHDFALIQSLAKLSEARDRKYRIAESKKRATADIFMVNGDDPFAMREAQNLVGQRSIAVIQVLKKLKEGLSAPHLVQPLVGKRVFQALDAVAVG